MKVVVIAPHPDDETLGCGGTLCLHTARGGRVVPVFLTSGELGLKHLPRKRAVQIREREAINAAKILHLTKPVFLRLPDWFVNEHVAEAAAMLAPILKRERPGLLYLPHPGEWHPDHQAALPIVRLALKSAKVPEPALRLYEVWTPLSEFGPVEDISAVMTRKLRALRAHRSQLKEFDYAAAVRGLNQFRGVLAGKCRFAEVFQTIASPLRSAEKAGNARRLKK